MRIGHIAARGEPTGWSPGVVAPSVSTRPPGLLRGGFDAWRGVPERSEGVPLTETQLTMLAPFLAPRFGLEAQQVREDLARVRVHVGGLAHDAGGTATAIGPNIYVSDAARATKLLSWEGRRWLVHELGHTMQWRRAGATDRAFLDAYLGAFVAYGGVGGGGLAQALQEWRRRRDAGEPIGNVGDLIHDSHPMEREAERAAAAFGDAHP